MEDMLASGMSFLDQSMRTYASKLVTYTRKRSSIVVPAQSGTSILRINDADGGAIVRTDKDFLISAADLIFLEAATVPHEGDLITEIIGAKTYTYRVERPTVTDDCWRYSDPYQNRFRIHTKAIDAEA